MDWWTQLSPGQGSLLAGVMTALGAVLGIIIAGGFFSGKVKTLKEALDTSQEMLERHAETVGDTLEGIRERISVLDAQTSSLASGLGRIEANTVELSESAEQAGLEQAGLEQAIEDPWNRVRELWFEIRDELERRASDEAIDGRTRAAYGRIDRRQYYLLIEKMTEKRTLTAAVSEAFDSALAIWQRYKSGRTAVRPDDINRMMALRDQVVQVAA